ncbi:hypothetical protein AAMO2058_001043100 [Amorphochlora amoebiformis]
MDGEAKKKAFAKFAVDDVAGVWKKLLSVDKNKEGKQKGKKLVGDMDAEDAVSCIECVLLFGLKGRLAARCSFWSFIVDISKCRTDSKFFQVDVNFVKSLYFEDDRLNQKRGRAWIRQCLNAGRLDKAMGIISTTPKVLARWVRPYSVFASPVDTTRLIAILKACSSDVRFEVQMHHHTRYTWKMVDGFPTRVYRKPRPPPAPRNEKPVSVVVGRKRQDQKYGGLAENVLKSLFGSNIPHKTKSVPRLNSREVSSPWIAYTDEETGCLYFYNALTDESSWDEPKEGYVTHESAADVKPTAGFSFLTIRQSNTNEPSHTPTPWIAYTDEESGCLYFYNTITDESSWEEPKEGYMTHESAVEALANSSLQSSSIGNM